MLACRLHNILVRLKNNSLNGFVFVFRYEKNGLPLTAIRFFSYLYVGQTPHPFSVSSSTNEGAF